ncbi:(S)-N-methylcoclaurine 3'-hydroxylase isozyme 1-like [Diospyros lotus]|uniref:(S)-N-methylcoclaurine 3'-hydroxylase isozyme 1-like n=1 Tax=Diospyros lotus TaxID=55363 RepID=UPI002257C3E8|nr:(S)-N-methylcoclaurine 3'-hydroxylase isozyme 1-like [Diospyros lotus]
MAETYLLLPLPILLFPLLLLFLKHFKASFLSNKPQLPPGPKPWPILGNILHMGKTPHVTLARFAQTYGPLISLRLGTQVLIVGSSPVVAAEILKTHDRIMSARYVPHAAPFKSPERNYLSLGLAAECNDAWKHLRTICRTELFSAKALQSQACSTEKKVMEMVEYLNSKEGMVVKLGEVVFATVFNMLSNVLLSRDLMRLAEGCMDGGMKGVIRELMEVVSAPNLSDFYPIFGPLDLQGLNKKWMKLLKKLHTIWEPIIQERRERKQGQGDFLDALIDDGFSDDQINQLLVELFGAGTDTTTSTIEWAIAELIKNPDSMKKVREELARELGKELPKESNLPKLPYLQACVKETLRLHPSAPLLLPRRALETCQVMNYTIPKDAQIIVNAWAIGRDPISWKDPLQFKPDRFLNSTMDYRGNDYELVPFGAGRRICPGLPMAAKVVPLVVSSLIHSFDWHLPLGNNPFELDMNEKFGITLQKEQPLLLIPTTKK